MVADVYTLVLIWGYVLGKKEKSESGMSFLILCGPYVKKAGYSHLI